MSNMTNIYEEEKRKENERYSDNLNSLVSRFEVIRKTGEYDFELLMGPYKDIDEAIASKKVWISRNKDQDVRVIAFINC